MASEMDADTTTAEYVDGFYITDDIIEHRKYQDHLVDAATTENTLIALPTGLGKTVIAARIVSRRLLADGWDMPKVLLIAPNKPLVAQHAETFREFLDLDATQIVEFTGEIRPDDREDIWTHDDTRVVIGTPQTIKNDLIQDRYTLENVAYAVFDECHNATGDSAYCYVAEHYAGNVDDGLVTGLSASPGTSKQDVLNVCKNIGATNIEVLTEDDDILADAIPDTEWNPQFRDLPDDVLEAYELVETAMQDSLKTLKNKFGYIDTAAKSVKHHQIRKAREDIQQAIRADQDGAYKAMSVQAEASKLYNLRYTIAAEGVEPAIERFETWEAEIGTEDGSKANQRIVRDDDVKRAIRLLREYREKDEVHPKVRAVQTVAATTDGRVLVFAEERTTVEHLVDVLSDYDHVFTTGRLVGQSDKENSPGMTQADQQAVLDRFRSGDIDVLVTTSVAEEGLDIPAVEEVVMYEPTAVKSMIQRRGRTGRDGRDGKVTILVSKDTVDETRYYIANSMMDNAQQDLTELRDLEDDIEAELRDAHQDLSESGFQPTASDAPLIGVDSREGQSSIPERIKRRDDAALAMETLEVGDYILSDRVVVERKELDDFLSTLLDGDRDLFGQIRDAADNYDRPVVIVEGGSMNDLYGRRNVHDEAIRSSIVSMAVDYNASVLFTDDEEETTEVLQTIARREQENNDRSVSMHGDKRQKTKAEQQEYIVAAIPEIGPVAAEALLDHFGSVYAVLTASTEDLTDVEGIGPETADRIVTLTRDQYNPED